MFIRQNYRDKLKRDKRLILISVIQKFDLAQYGWIDFFFFFIYDKIINKNGFHVEITFASLNTFLFHCICTVYIIIVATLHMVHLISS